MKANKSLEIYSTKASIVQEAEEKVLPEGASV